jgi:hypothetical protein
MLNVKSVAKAGNEVCKGDAIGVRFVFKRGSGSADKAARLLRKGVFIWGKNFPERARNFREKWLMIGSSQLVKRAFVMFRAILQNKDTNVSAA